MKEEGGRMKDEGGRMKDETGTGGRMAGDRGGGNSPTYAIDTWNNIKVSAVGEDLLLVLEGECGNPDVVFRDRRTRRA
jgi:hypothetical protein